jgi:hypothetical protein
MVGVGPEGVESSLARVSLVNYYGAVQLDAFVRQRERVVDYRTQYSGVRETDMVNGGSFRTHPYYMHFLIKIILQRDHSTRSRSRWQNC